MSTGLVHHPQFLKHDTGPGHPERPDRLVYTLAHLEKQTFFDRLTKISPRPAELSWIETTHTPEYIERVRQICRQGAGNVDTADVVVSRESFDAALLAAGAALELADKIMSREVQNGFGLLRPPGHHAERDLAMGFCLFNNAAIAARYFQKKHGLERILILDWDVHHGNGTQHSFEEDPSVLYISLHQYPYYPGTGSAGETGTGKGKGATLNCPMKAGATEADYREAFTSRIIPKVEDFKPDAVILSAGFDAHERDPLAQICLTSDSFAWMTERVMEMADRHSQGRVLSLLEGGYDPKALRECVARHVGVLSHEIDRKILSDG